MPEVRRTRESIPGARIGAGGATYDALRRGYRHRPPEEQPEPAQIVAALRARIAAQSPEHAALVAAYEAKREEEAARLAALEAAS